MVTEKFSVMSFSKWLGIQYEMTLRQFDLLSVNEQKLIEDTYTEYVRIKAEKHKCH